jgi:hypothetical protein
LQEKRLDKKEKAEEKKGSNQLISIEKTGFITYRLSQSLALRESFSSGYIYEADGFN